MKPTVDHVILTRFNLPSRGSESLVRAKESWLRDRVQLFEDYCLPSVLAQQAWQFTWIIYFDPHSPQWLKERIAQYVERGYFVAIFREEVDSLQLLGDIRSVGAGNADVLLTTNLDNDDGLSLDFVQRLQEAVTDAETRALYVSNGLIQCQEKVYLRTDPVNAFCSVAAPWNNVTTCWMDWHNLLGNHMPITQIAGAPGWLQVIHESNVSNRVRGQLTSPQPYRENFAGGLPTATEPGASSLLLERAVLVPWRISKEMLRAGAKSLLMRLGGRELLDRAKSWMRRGSIIAR